MKTIRPVLVFLAGASAAIAQSPGTFTPTGNMSVPRILHRATLLDTGKVLVTGGYAFRSGNGEPVWASAELYDSSLGTFSATGDMSTARQWHTATLLANGKVLVAGGIASKVNFGLPYSSLSSAELYDPSDGTFSATGRMMAARGQHSATLLNNGKVLIAGGVSYFPATSAATALDSVELYDPSTGTFAPAADMTTARCQHTATLLQTGKVLIVPGGACAGLGKAEVFDPDTGRFSPIDSNLGFAVAPVATLLTNGRVLLTLSFPEDESRSAVLYNPSTETFAATGNMTAPRFERTATALPDGTVLIAGLDFEKLVDNADLYDPVAGTFSPLFDPQAGRSEHTATLLPDGTVLIAGGLVCCELSPAPAQLYHPPLLAPAPTLLSVSAGGQGEGAILHAATHQLVSSSNPALAGEPLEIYLTGLIDGSVIPPQVAIGGRMAEILYFGNAPGLRGLNQVNVRVPEGVGAGPTVPVRLRYLSRPSNAVTIAVEVIQ